ncbi:unnamed protein product [Amoebophrya sp. A25]|nr:unnamed protein product [Amoebophrya sp. A25]|eukprot:GSA25T00007548001.1
MSSFSAGGGFISDRDVNTTIARNNIVRTLWINIFLVIGSTITFGPVFDKYVLTLSDRNWVVGLVESASGLTSLLVFLPVAFLVDKYLKKRSKLVLKSASLLLLGFVILVIAILTDSFYVLFPALFMNGLFYELSAGVTGDRAAWYVKKQVYTTVAAGVGPLLTLLLALSDGKSVSVDPQRPSFASTFPVVHRYQMGIANVAVQFPQSPSSLLSMIQKGLPEDWNNTIFGEDSTSSSSSDKSTRGRDENLVRTGGIEIADQNDSADKIRSAASTTAWSWSDLIRRSSGLRVERESTEKKRRSSLSVQSAQANDGEDGVDMSSIGGRSAALRSEVTTTPLPETDSTRRTDIGDTQHKMVEQEVVDHMEGTTSADPASAGDETPWSLAFMHLVLLAGSAVFLPIFCFIYGYRDLIQEQDAEGMVKETDDERHLRKLTRAQKLVPFFCGISDFIVAVGAGMTVKFFNLFFIEDYKFTPLQICALQTAYPLTIALFTMFLAAVAKVCGRAQTSAVSFTINALCMILMSTLEDVRVLVVVFLLRGGMANGVNPLDRSILMDYTPSTQRGLWNAVQSFTSITWSGSAFLGGYIADVKDYRQTFRYTGYVYLVGVAIYFPLVFLVPRKAPERCSEEPRSPSEMMPPTISSQTQLADDVVIINGVSLPNDGTGSTSPAGTKQPIPTEQPLLYVRGRSLSRDADC